MKRKLICWLPLLLLIGCSQPTYRTTSLTPDKRAELLLKELTLEETVYEVFNAVSDEARAKNTYYASQGSYERYQGLTMWTPTVNIYRDPRWGRGI